MESILEIKQLRLSITLGVGALERAELQEVDFNIRIKFSYIPKGCASDKIDDALCYDKLSKAIDNFCKNNQFHLIEHLSFALHKYIKANYLNSEDKLMLQVCKLPPVEVIKGQCCFTVED